MRDSGLDAPRFPLEASFSSMLLFSDPDPHPISGTEPFKQVWAITQLHSPSQWYRWFFNDSRLDETTKAFLRQPQNR